jgi:predicted ArsR family transcriptional regulator
VRKGELISIREINSVKNGMIRIELASTILSYCNETALSVSELARKVGGNYENTMAQLKELKKRGLLLSEISRDKGVGRPKQLLQPASLGKRFMSEYKRLNDLSLRSSDNDLRKALNQAELARRLVESGISPYARFQEINELARNVASTAKVKRNTR